MWGRSEAEPVVLTTPHPDELPGILDQLGEWQVDGNRVPLHPGDLGWLWRFGAETVARATRCWYRDGRIAAVGMLDGEALVRVAIDPAASDDERLARQIADDLADASRGVLPAGPASVEVRGEGALRARLRREGWEPDELWTPLVRDVSEQIPEPTARVDVVDADNAPQIADRVTVQRAAFRGSTFTVARWQAMAAGPGYAQARCLVVYDPDDTPVAAATVWSAGRGRPGLLEPVGAHPDHRGRGYGKALLFAAQRVLRDLGASSATVCTDSANTVGVAAYRSAGFRALPEVADLRRDA